MDWAGDAGGFLLMTASCGGCRLLNSVIVRRLMQRDHFCLGMGCCCILVWSWVWDVLCEGSDAGLRYVAGPAHAAVQLCVQQLHHCSLEAVQMVHHRAERKGNLGGFSAALGGTVLLPVPGELAGN